MKFELKKKYAPITFVPDYYGEGKKKVPAPGRKAGVWIVTG